jgi:hypothetical protein
MIDVNLWFFNATRAHDNRTPHVDVVAGSARRRFIATVSLQTFRQSTLAGRRSRIYAKRLEHR